MTSTLLSANDVAVHKGARVVLERVNLTVRSGEIWQLCGHNGVGKTSLLRALAGLATIEVFGDITRCDDVLFSGHAPAVKKTLTARENLRSHPSGLCVPTDAEINWALASVQLRGYEDIAAGRLSAGQKRRVALGRLFMPSAPLWLLDEPFTALDEQGIRILEKRFLAHADAGGAVVFTSHQVPDLGDNLLLCDLEHYHNG